MLQCVVARVNFAVATSITLFVSPCRLLLIRLGHLDVQTPSENVEKARASLCKDAARLILEHECTPQDHV